MLRRSNNSRKLHRRWVAAAAARTFSTMTPFGVVPSLGTSGQAQTKHKRCITSQHTLKLTIAKSLERVMWLWMCLACWFVPLSAAMMYRNERGIHPKGVGKGVMSSRCWVRSIDRRRLVVAAACFATVCITTRMYHTMYAQRA